jgi:hypothetical protein
MRPKTKTTKPKRCMLAGQAIEVSECRVGGSLFPEGSEEPVQSFTQDHDKSPMCTLQRPLWPPGQLEKP